MPHEKDRPASGSTYVEPGELSARERVRHLKPSPTMSIPIVAQQQQPQPSASESSPEEDDAL